MIDIAFFVDDSKEERTHEKWNVKNLNRIEAALCIQWLESIKLDLLDTEFELGEDGVLIEEDG